MILTNSTKGFSSREELLKEVNSYSTLAVDMETVSLKDHTPLGVALAWSPNDAIYFTADDPDFPTNIFSYSLRILFHNALFDQPIIEEHWGVRVNCIGDTMLLAQSMGMPASLEELSLPYNVGFPHQNIVSLLADSVGKRIKGKTIASCDPQEVGRICCEHAQGTYKIWEKWRGERSRAYDLDFHLLPLLLDMHKRGFPVDSVLAKQRSEGLQEEVDYIRGICDGLGFNPASPLQVGMALSYEGLSTHYNKRGQMVTDEEALRPLMHKTPIVPLVLKFRGLNVLNSTFVRPLSTVNRVYPRYRIVRTGRFASSPNVQNIPIKMRDLYLPDTGEYLWDGDMKQIEPLLMAHLSGDVQMIRDIETGDIYQPIADRYAIERYTAKQLLLASSYGAGPQRLVETALDHNDVISIGDAALLQMSFRNDYRQFHDWGEQVRLEASSKGYVTTLLGRRRSLESMSEGERWDYDPLLKAVNTKVQGSAADLLKLAMLLLERYKILATVHDEIIISTFQDIDLEEIENLEGIPISWDVGRGKTWLEAKG